MKTGLPRHLIMTCSFVRVMSVGALESPLLTFLPSGIRLRSISTLACARTSAEADMLTRKSRVAYVSQ